jgi:hypothetical protein
MNEDTYPPETLELIYNEVKDRLNTQFQSLDGLNTKASVIIGFVGVIIGRRDPEPRALTEKYLWKDDKTVKKQLIDNFIVSFEENKTKIEEKVKYINYSLIFLFVGLVVLISSVIVG